uniref:Putative secreted protein n=1 Tax=Anopheles darlingi TaxID=43151 RepID=A0A2M4D8H1_ANODA
MDGRVVWVFGAVGWGCYAAKTKTWSPPGQYCRGIDNTRLRKPRNEKTSWRRCCSPPQWSKNVCVCMRQRERARERDLLDCFPSRRMSFAFCGVGKGAALSRRTFV